MLWVQVNDVNLVVQIAIVFKLKQVWKVWNTVVPVSFRRRPFDTTHLLMMFTCKS